MGRRTVGTAGGLRTTYVACLLLLVLMTSSAVSQRKSSSHNAVVKQGFHSTQRTEQRMQRNRTDVTQMTQRRRFFLTF